MRRGQTPPPPLPDARRVCGRGEVVRVSFEIKHNYRNFRTVVHDWPLAVILGVGTCMRVEGWGFCGRCSNCEIAVVNSNGYPRLPASRHSRGGYASGRVRSCGRRSNWEIIIANSTGCPRPVLGRHSMVSPPPPTVRTLYTWGVIFKIIFEVSLILVPGYV